MRIRLSQTTTELIAIPALLATAALTGCGASPISTPVSAIPSGNWQIQTGTAITSPPTGNYIIGAIQMQGSSVTGTFTNKLPCSPAISDYTGSVDSSGNLTLNSTFDQVKLVVPAKPYTMTTGFLGGGGNLCQIVGGGSAVGTEIPPLTGTYTGKLASAGSSGNATLVVMQASSPNANGQFPVTGTLQFTAASCTSSAEVTGTISGTGFTLNSADTALSGYDNAGGATLPASVSFTSGNCGGSAFTGTLALQ